MMVFRGILNKNGSANKIQIFFDFDTPTPYTSRMYIDNISYDIIITDSSCIIENIPYDYKVKNFKDETIIVGKEPTNLFHCCCPCFFKPNFFVLTNRDEYNDQV